MSNFPLDPHFGDPVRKEAGSGLCLDAYQLCSLILQEQVHYANVATSYFLFRPVGVCARHRGSTGCRFCSQGYSLMGSPSDLGVSSPKNYRVQGQTEMF